MPCKIDTFDAQLPSLGFLAKRHPLSARIVAEIQDAATNPKLKKCGRMKVCIGCEIGAYAETLEMSQRVAQKIAQE